MSLFVPGKRFGYICSKRPKATATSERLKNQPELAELENIAQSKEIDDIHHIKKNDENQSMDPGNIQPIAILFQPSEFFPHPSTFNVILEFHVFSNLKLDWLHFQIAFIHDDHARYPGRIKSFNFKTNWD